MLGFLYNWFSWVPVLGEVIKTAYIGSLVAKLVSMASGWTPDDGTRGRTGAELDEALDEEANEMVTEMIEPLELGLIADMVRRAAVGKMVSEMRKQIVS